MTDYSVDSWEQHFKPITNHFDPCASWSDESGEGGIMFETFGEEWDFVANQPEENVWSYMDDEDDNLIICGGRVTHQPVIGYFVTQVAREPLDANEENHICITVETAEERA